MGVLLQGFYMRGNRGVPCPLDGDVGAAFWWDHLAAQAHELASAGFSAIWLPPPLKGGSGIFSIGYDVFDDYDLGSKNQRGHVATRHGTRDQLARCMAMLRANGLDVYVDLVPNQRDGETGGPGVFRYAGADGRVGDPVHDGHGGRFPKNPGCFHFIPGGVPQDPNVVQDFDFGRDLAPINGQPPGYVFQNLLASADWLVRAMGVQGVRMDDVKGLSTDFLFPLLQHGALAGKFAVGEYPEVNTAVLRSWVFNPHGMRGRLNVFDFPLHALLKQMCNNAGFFDMSQLDHAGMAGSAPAQAVTFVENHDTDSGGVGGPTVINKLQGYAYILTSEGYPSVFYKDYSTDPGCYGLKPALDNLIWIHEKIADGPTQQRWKEFSLFAFERLGGHHLLVGLNNDPGRDRTITVDTDFGSNVSLHDYTGHSGDISTDAGGRARITIPRNLNGTGYVCYSRQGIGGGFERPRHSVTQEFEGAVDLDIPPAVSVGPVTIGQIFADAGSSIKATLSFNTKGWASDTRIDLSLMGSQLLAKKTFTAATPHAEALLFHAPQQGSYTFKIQTFALPPVVANLPYVLSVTYTASRSVA